MNCILIIEDDPVTTRIYRSRFEFAGFQVLTAPDGEQAVSLLSRARPDLILLDLMLPKMNGIAVLRFLRSQPATRATPVIVFSNSYVSALVKKAWEAGANRCLAKAECTPRQLLVEVRDLLAESTEHRPSAASPPAPEDSPAEPSSLTRPSTSMGLKGLDPDISFQEQLRQEFLQDAPRIGSGLRAELKSFARSQTDSTRLPDLFKLYRSIHSVTGHAGLVGLTRIAQMSSALEALLQELYETPKRITPSTLPTVARGVDFLITLFNHDGVLETGGRRPSPLVLAVDDDPFSRRVVSAALERAGLRPVTLAQGATALQVLETTRFDLVLLDVDLPDINGHELCRRLRRLVLNETTPVIFVTGHADFESRARSTLSGGSDLIAKPFLLTELAVKTLTYILKLRSDARAVPARRSTEPD